MVLDPFFRLVDCIVFRAWENLFPVFVDNLKPSLPDIPQGLTEIDFQITASKRDRAASLSRPLLWQVLPWQHGYRLQRGDLVPVPPQSPIQSP